jgi:negative regulator of sigma E activity
MTRLLIGSVLALALGVWAMRQMNSSSAVSTPDAATNQVEDARQDVHEAVDREAQRAKDLSQDLDQNSNSQP